MSTYASVKLNFIRYNTESKDDIIHIVKLGENAVQVTYREWDIKGYRTSCLKLDYQQLFAYLYRTFWMVWMDHEPFEFVQFFVPGYPTTLLNVSVLQENISSIMEMFMSTCWNWPSTP